MPQTMGSVPSPPLQSKPAGSFVFVPSALSLVNGERASRRERGGWKEHLTVSVVLAQGLLGHLPHPPQPRSPKSLLCSGLCLSLERLPPSWTSYGRAFRDWVPSGRLGLQALPCLPRVSGTLKNLLLCVDLSVLVC